MMMMSADGDDQADQQHELADPSMTEPGHAVLETPWPDLENFRTIRAIASLAMGLMGSIVPRFCSKRQIFVQSDALSR